MAKKRIKNKPSLLSFLLRDFKGRPDSDESKNEPEKNEAAEACLACLAEAPATNTSSRLLSSLLRDVKKRPDPEEEKIKKELEKKIHNEGETNEEEDEFEEEGSNDETSPAESGKNLLQGRFEVLPANPLGDDYNKRAGAAVKNSSGSGIRSLEEATAQVRRGADNYRQMYLEQRAQEEASTAEKEQAIAENKRKAQDTANKKTQEEQIAAAYRFRARELQNQIAWWRQQQGLGQYDDATINSTVDNMQRELSGIPDGYR